MSSKFGLTNNQLKIIAAISMFLDHIGAELLPQYVILRIIGRIAFPIFAYAIYEGTKYTHNKLKYFLQIFILGIICLIGYYLYCGELYGNVLITFSFSILTIYGIMEIKEQSIAKNYIKMGEEIILFTGYIIAVYSICNIFYIDYGFAGIVLPVFAGVFDLIEIKISSNTKKLLNLASFTIGLLYLSEVIGSIQIYCLLTVLILLAANGTRGKYKMKYFFYLFYPLHLLLVGALSIII